jgi:DinB superfamily
MFHGFLFRKGRNDLCPNQPAVLSIWHCGISEDKDTFAPNKSITTMNNNQLFHKMIFDRWNGALKNCDSLLNSLSDEQLQKQIAPGKNRGVYLLGHLIAVHDDMLILLDLGDKLYPELKQTFIDSPDDVSLNESTARQLREFWKNQCAHMQQKFDSIPLEGWFEKHTAVSAADFANEPHRNKLNIILTRTTHLSYHTGQLALLK